jgi:hypothetical protein
MIDEALAAVRERGYLLQLENTDGWFIAHTRPPKEIAEALMESEEISDDDAYAMIEAGLVKARLQYLLECGTRVSVFTPSDSSAVEIPSATTRG